MHMKLSLIGALLLINIAFISGSHVVANEREAALKEAASIEILNLHVLPSGKVLLKCTNSGSKPVKAFKGKWVVLDDFDEASLSGDILFTSSTAVVGSNAVLGGYLVQPNDIIYFVYEGHQQFAMVGRPASDLFGIIEEAPLLKNKYKAAVTNVIFADAEDVERVRKQEEALREQEKLRSQEMARQADEAAREAEQKRQFGEMLKQSRTPTREIARIPMEDSRDHFIVTDVSVEYRGARKDFQRAPNLHAGDSKAIVEDGIYSYFATQADRDKALQIFNDAIKAWQKKFPDAVDAFNAPSPPRGFGGQTPESSRMDNQVSKPQPSQTPLPQESDPAEDFAKGKALSRGEGGAQDLHEATRYYRRAADRGYAPAQHQLGVAYAKGWGVVQNDAEAVNWYRKAAEQGLPEAQHDLGVRYILGLGTQKDVAAGVEWYRKAAAQGWQESVVALQKYDAAPLAAGSTPTAIVTGIAADDYLSVRSAPAMNSKELLRLKKDQKIQIRGDSVFNGDTEWVPISAELKQGWVRKKYLRPQ
jgi:TPR repeat protein